MLFRDSDLSTYVPSLRRAVALGVLAALTLVATPAWAQLARIGNTIPAIGATVRGTDSAYDPVNDVYLVVGAYGPVWGVFVSGSGPASSPVGAPFLIKNNNTAIDNWGHMARVAYSPHINGTGGFLVVWHQYDGAANPRNVVHSRIVTFANGVIGNEGVISDPNIGSWHEAGAAIAYSPTSQVFMVVWQGGVVLSRAVGIDGQPLGSVVPIVAGSISYGRDPGVTWNAATNQFGISFNGEDAISVLSGFAIVGANGALVRCDAFSRAKLTYITDIAYNATTGRYVMVWFQVTGNPLVGSIQGAEFDSAGNLIAQGIASVGAGAYDGLALSYNTVSNTFLLVGHHSTPEVGGVELNQRGTPLTTAVVLTAAGGATSGAFYPRAARHASAPRWNITFARDFVAGTHAQAIGTATTGGGGNVALGPGGGPPPPATVTLAVTIAGNGSVASAPGGISCPGSCTSVFNQNTSVSLTPSAASGWTFAGWSGSCSGTGACVLPMNVNMAVGATFTQNGPPPGGSGVRGDLNADGKPDLVFQHANGQLFSWFMNGPDQMGGAALSPGSTDPTWQIVGVADFNSDNHSDVLWQHGPSGTLYVWFMNRTTMTGGTYLTPGAVASNWRLAAIADFNGDTKPDILWQQVTTGHLYVWFMNGTAQAGGSYLNPNQVPTDWQVAGAADLDANGTTDVVWRNAINGQVYVWYMNGVTTTHGAFMTPGQVHTAWKIVALSDFNADGRADVVWQHDTGDLYVWFMVNGVQSGGGFLTPGHVDPLWKVKGVK
jgi:hypothetical protein